MIIYLSGIGMLEYKVKKSCISNVFVFNLIFISINIRLCFQLGVFMKLRNDLYTLYLLKTIYKGTYLIN